MRSLIDSDDFSGRTVRLLLFSVFLIYAYGALRTPVSYKYDDFTHFYHAYLFPQKFHYLFDTWDRPLFIILYFIPAKFGIYLSRILTAAIATLTVYFTFKALHSLKVRYSVFVIPLLALQPYFFGQAYTVMTELLFAFIISLSLFLFFSKKWPLFLLVLGLLPLVRNEGFAFLALGVVFLVPVRKKIKFLLKDLIFLLSPSLLYSFSGAFFYKDFFWLVTKNAYKETICFAGFGRNLIDNYFFTGFDLYFNDIYKFLFFLGFFVSVPLFFTKNKKIAIVYPALPVMYLTIALIRWCGPMKYWLGEPRYLVTIAPVLALYSLFGLSFVINSLEGLRFRWVSALVILSLSTYTVFTKPFNQYNYHNLVDVDVAMILTAEWFKTSPFRFEKRPIVHSYAGTPYLFNGDPDDFEFAIGGTYLRESIKMAPQGALIIWHRSIYAPAGYDEIPLSELKEKKDLSPVFNLGVGKEDILVVFEKI